MSTINLTYRVMTIPDFDSFKFSLPEWGAIFNIDDYMEAYNLRASDIDPDDIKAVQDACGHLNPGEWLEVTHETRED